MKKLVILILFFAFTDTAYTQPGKGDLLKQADTFLGSPKAKVLPLGVFHFDYPGLDYHKTRDNYKIDILSNERQKELKELVRLLSGFNPTKIMVESMSQTYVDSLYRRYLTGALKNSRDEIVQIGFRLARLMKHDMVYAADAPITSMSISEEQLNEFESDFINQEKRWKETYGQYFDFMDSLKKNLPLKDYLVFLNSNEVHQRDHGQYLLFTSVGTKDQPAGADLWFPRWFNRNVRIFANINDRVLVIFGNGHMHILKDLFKASHDFELVGVEKYLK